MKEKAVFLDTKERDIKILQSIANDKTRSEIADEFDLSIRTVEAIIDKWRFKYGCKREAGLIYLLIKDGIIS